jgi:hypothetical protein
MLFDAAYLSLPVDFVDAIKGEMTIQTKLLASLSHWMYILILESKKTTTGRFPRPCALNVQ